MGEPVAFGSLRAAGIQRLVDDVPLVAPTDLEVTPGRGVVLRGPNGSGKTTLLRMMTGAVRPTRGEVTLDGEQVDERRPRVRSVIAALLDPVTGWSELTLQDHLVLVDQTWGGPRETCAERVDAVLALLDVEPLRHRFLHEMSSGQRQLADLAMTLIRPAGVLVLDEPEQRLDTGRRALLGRVLADLKRAGTALLLACHDDALTQAVADEVVTLAEAGR